MAGQAGIEPPKVFDIRKVKVYVDGTEITGFAPDGFGVTPGAETTMIAGLKGQVGFNVDPSTGAELTLTLKSTSDSNTFLRGKMNTQQEAMGSETPFKPMLIEIIVDDGWEGAFGFKRKVLEYAVITKWPDYETDEKESPDLEWGFMGYGYKEE